MPTIAVISDIHGNLRALEAVISDIATREVTKIVNLGDCAYGPFDPRPVMNRLQELDMPTVSGNEDRILVETANGRSHSRTATFTANLLEPSHIAWLADLPGTLHWQGTFLVHGTAESDTTYLLTEVSGSGAVPRSAEAVAARIGAIPEQVILCGHDHTPGTVKLDSGRVVVNPGSVGCPAYTDDVPHEHRIEVGSPHARYAILVQEPGNVHIEWVRVVYDWNAAAEEAAANGFKNWAVWLRTGRT
ncbi:metallophosphoesterase family protein [Candidatus Bipolaricaulota bacterium]